MQVVIGAVSAMIRGCWERIVLPHLFKKHKRIGLPSIQIAVCFCAFESCEFEGRCAAAFYKME